MKWLNIITDSETFYEITYELYASEKDFNKYSPYVSEIRTLYENKKALFDEAMDKMQKYIKKSKKQIQEVYSGTVQEDGTITFSAIDPKVASHIDTINASWIYIDRLKAFLDTPYVFTEKDIELMAELKDMEWPSARFVYSLPFPVSTSWKKLGVSEEFKHAFVVALAMAQMSESIV